LSIQNNLEGQFPINRGFCKANINGYNYDFTTMGSARVYDSFEFEDTIYYIKLCSEINATLDNIPDFDPELDTHDVFVASCNKTTKKCQTLITENSWDWKFFNPHDPTTGVIYYAYGEPVPIKNSEFFFTFDIEVNVQCDSNVNDPRVEAKIVFTNDGSNQLLKMTISNKWGCGQVAGFTPTPTPSPFEPDCNFTDRLSELSSLGLDVHLDTLNGGPYGIRVPVKLGGIGGYALYYQPCERAECPPGYSCGSDNYSSSWLCNENEHQCDSYGVTQDEVFIDENPSGPYSGVIVTMKHPTENKKTVLNLKCSQLCPDGHIKFKDTIQVYDEVLTFEGETKEACIERLPEPTPEPPGGRCTFSNKIGESMISINLNKYDKNDTKGWIKEVDVQEQEGISKAQLMYEPCDNIYCPDGADCDGDEDATVFLCNGTGSNQECIGYGLIKEVLLSNSRIY